MLCVVSPSLVFFCFLIVYFWGSDTVEVAECQPLYGLLSFPTSILFFFIAFSPRLSEFFVYSVCFMFFWCIPHSVYLESRVYLIVSPQLGFTALGVAVDEGKTQAVEMLLKFGAATDVANVSVSWLFVT